MIRFNSKTAVLFLAPVMAIAGWENPLVNSVNREPARAYSMPLAKAADALTHETPKTPYVKLLNGIWKIRWAGNPALRPQGFWKPDYDDSKWYDIDVPSCVETRGFGSPGYVNVEYPHLKKPPYIRDNDTGAADYNPVSSYRTYFTVPESWEGRETILRFDGVYSAFKVWINGHEVGYSEDSKLAAEFRIGAYLKPGKNLLAVEVRRWCDGSYLEGQDMFRFSGIFRDVSLLSVPRNHIFDFYVKSELDQAYRNAKVSLQVQLRRLAPAGAEPSVEAVLYDSRLSKVGGFKVVKAAKDGKTELSLDLPNARLWSAEDPYLYTLVITAGEDVRTCKVGVRSVERKGNTVLFNGKKIKFKGVNRHEHSPVNGRTVTREEMLRDIMMFKRFNINTVRTAHYPDHPYWYELCDRYGIYVCAEANVEGHGMDFGEHGLGRQPDWNKAIVERNANHATVLRNHPSIFMWSLGNETGTGSNFADARDAVRKIDATRPIHWQAGNDLADVDSEMYPSVEWLYKRGQLGEGKLNYLQDKQYVGKPFFLCEYAHAMGNAMGNFKEYWDAFYSSDSLIGGCVWDWVDQGLVKTIDRLDADGKRISYWAYGGDYDEKPNNGPFCNNGIVTPDRRVTPKLIELAHVHRQLTVISEGDSLRVNNRFSFTPSSAFDADWALIEDGVAIERGEWKLPEIAPLSSIAVPLPNYKTALKAGREYFLNLSFRLRRDEAWAKRGHVIASDQIAVAPAATALPRAVKVDIAEKSDSLEVVCGPTKAVFSRKTGTLCQLTMNGKTILADVDGMVCGPRAGVNRAFTDNDVWLRNGAPWTVDRAKAYYSFGLTQLRYHPRPFEITTAADGATVIKSEVEITGSKSAGFLHKCEWSFAADGSVIQKNCLIPFGTMPPALPRIGSEWKLSGELENMQWYGRGPYENYVDRKSGSFIGRYVSTVSEQYEPYVRPQDCGYKCDVRWASFTGKDGAGVRFYSTEPLAVQALHYDWEDLEFARHRSGQERIYNVKPPRKEVCLKLDVRQLGLGGGSCGPSPMEKYTFPIEETCWTVVATPVAANRR